jgi:hypothetical protein
MLPPQHSLLELHDAPLCLQFDDPVVPPLLPVLVPVTTGGLHVGTSTSKGFRVGPELAMRSATSQLETCVSGEVHDVGALEP